MGPLLAGGDLDHAGGGGGGRGHGLPGARKAYQEFAARDWRLDVERGERFQNAFIAGLIGSARLAARFGDGEMARAAARAAAEALRRLAEEWQERVAGLPTSEVIGSVSDVDRFISSGNPLFFRVVPHRQKIARFLDLTPEVGRAIRETVPEAARSYLSYVDAVLPGWYLAWEERQVHWGENYLDFPDQALSIFQARAWIEKASRVALSRWLDLPWCPGDLYHIQKLVLSIEASGREEWVEDAR